MSGEGDAATGIEGADSADSPVTGSVAGSEGPVTVETPDCLLAGRGIDLRGRIGSAVTAEGIVAAVRRSRGDSEDGPDEEADVTDHDVAVGCPDPGPVHDHVGLVKSGMSLRTRTALAAAARSRGLSAPQDEELASIRAELAELTVPEVDTKAARERLAGTESAVQTGREHVATIRGRLQAARDTGRETNDLREELRAAVRELSEVETERAAAREALDRAERRARESRDARERRRRLEDRAANLERAARAHLVDALREEYVTAVTVVPEAGRSADSSGAGGDPFDADPVTAALAVGRVAELRAPVVLAVDRFEHPDAAVDWLDGPVVRV
jgi:hypothetical protein